MNPSFRTIAALLITIHSSAQVVRIDSTDVNNARLDSIFIAETEEIRGIPKVLHAEPLFIDLIRDLGARKGEREWNIGTGMTDRSTHDYYSALIEYEFAPVDRLGLEVELPFSFYLPSDSLVNKNDLPGDRLNAVKLAAQYSFLVNEKQRLSMAIGYIHELENVPFRSYGKEKLFSGNLYNPFFIAAKRWGRNFHTLVYTGPQIIKHFSSDSHHTIWQLNTNLHYMISGTRNFIGIELNKEISEHDFDMTIRPQMRIGLADNLLVGVVTGIPIHRETQRLSMFLRLIYEPPHRQRH